MSASPAVAIQYAEETLGVHSAFEAAKTARDTLDEILTQLANKKDEIRDLEFKISDVEMEVTSDERGRHPDMSVSGMERHLKVAFANNDTHRELREQIAKARSDAEGLEFDRHVADVDVRIAVARMEQLAGYFHYLAIVKDVANPRGGGSNVNNTVAATISGDDNDTEYSLQELL